MTNQDLSSFPLSWNDDPFLKIRWLEDDWPEDERLEDERLEEERLDTVSQLTEAESDRLSPEEWYY